MALTEILSIGDALNGREVTTHPFACIAASLTLNQWQNPSPVDFHLLVLGTQHSLPTPVERRGQKTFKPDYFDVAAKERDAWDGVRDVRTWLAEVLPSHLHSYTNLTG